MSLPLLLPESTLDNVLCRFRSWLAEPDTPVRAIRHEAATAGSYAAIPDAVHRRLREALAGRGVDRLYTHQAETFELAQGAKHVAIVTPTASGKTLCYNLPVLNLMLRDPGARAMYLFPTKALAEDQLHELQSAIDEMGSEIRAFTYDGDTPQDAAKQSHPPASQRGADQSGHAAHRHPSAPHPMGQAVREFAFRGDR